MSSMSLIFALLLGGSDAPLLAMPPSDDDRPASRLAPLDPASPWTPRFAAVAADLAPALASRHPGNWLPLFGGQWLDDAGRARILATLADANGGLNRALAGNLAVEHVVLGWQPPEGGAAYAAEADRPEADAIICWRARGSSAPWPTTAREADDTRAHGCVRVSYSLRFGAPQWRAFIEPPVDAASQD